MNVTLTGSGVMKLAYTINEASKISNIGKTLLYKHLGAGSLKAKKLGNKTLILHADLAAFLEGLEDY